MLSTHSTPDILTNWWSPSNNIVYRSHQLLHLWSSITSNWRPSSKDIVYHSHRQLHLSLSITSNWSPSSKDILSSVHLQFSSLLKFVLYLSRDSKTSVCSSPCISSRESFKNLLLEIKPFSRHYKTTADSTSTLYI